MSNHNVCFYRELNYPWIIIKYPFYLIFNTGSKTFPIYFFHLWKKEIRTKLNWCFIKQWCFVKESHHYAMFNTQLYQAMVVLSIIMLWWFFYPSLCCTHNCIYPSLCYVQYTTVSCDGYSIHHYTLFNTQLYQAMVVLSIIMLYTQLHLSIIMLCSTHNCIMWWLFYPSLCYVQHTTVSCDGCSIHHYAIFHTQLYHVMVVLSIIMLCSTHNCIMWWLFNPSLNYVQHTPVSCDGCSIHHYALFNTQLYGCSTLNI